MVAHSAGETFEEVTDAGGRPAAEADRSGGAVFRLDPWPPPIGPGSWPLALRTLVQPAPVHAASVVSGWLPRGIVSTEPLRRPDPAGRPRAAGLPTPDCGSSPATTRPASGSRSGARARPPAELADAVAASCAIPGFYRPVEIGGRRYVDGGMYSTSNLDLLRAEALDLVICLNPTSSLHPIRADRPARVELARLPARVRAPARQRGEEAPRRRYTGGPRAAARRRPADDEPQPDEHSQPERGDRGRPPHGRRAAARAGGRRARCRPAARAPREGHSPGPATVGVAAADRASARPQPESRRRRRRRRRRSSADPRRRPGTAVPASAGSRCSISTSSESTGSSHQPLLERLPVVRVVDVPGDVDVGGAERPRDALALRPVGRGGAGAPRRRGRRRSRRRSR